jgi:uncharacterized protein (TIGR03437 family)
VYGFQLSARLESNQMSGQAGRFQPIDGTTYVRCQDNRERGSGTCAAATPVEFIEHFAASSSNAFTIEWTPPATDVGNVRVYVAGNAANGNGQPTGDRIFLNNYTLTPQASSSAPQLRAESPVLQAFSGLTALSSFSSGTYLEIYGSNLSTTTREWAGSDFTDGGNQAPTSLDGVRVNINGKPAFVSFVSPTQINVQAPDDDALGNVQVEIENAAGKSNAVTAVKTRVSPALHAHPSFNVGGRRYVVAFSADFSAFIGRENLVPGAGRPFRPARPGETITIFAMGCGPSNPPSPAGRVVPSTGELRLMGSQPQVTFGQTVAQTVGFMAPPFVGLCKCNNTVPNITGVVPLE